MKRVSVFLLIRAVLASIITSCVTVVLAIKSGDYYSAACNDSINNLSSNPKSRNSASVLSKAHRLLALGTTQRYIANALANNENDKYRLLVNLRYEALCTFTPMTKHVKRV
jgi:hypothetical protein